MKSVKYLLIFTILIWGCKKPYSPKGIVNATNYLVVEGFINTGPDSTIITLSRTVKLSSGTTTNTEANAVVAVESDANASYPLKELKSGYYAAVGLNLDNAKKYRLRINTSDQQQYLSDFVTVKVTPPIDSIGYNVTGTGVQFYVNTHDPNNNTRYYRWSYDETWQFHAKYYSYYILNGQNFVIRTPQQQIYDCFTNDRSSNVILGSSAKLSQDVIYQYPITTVASTSEKIETKYSILLRQYALTSDAYTFWQNLQKNTEQLGSIFDAQPSTSGGNIHNVKNPSVPAVGYISAGTISSKRIFISSSQLPLTWITTYPYDCPLDSGYYCDTRYQRNCLNTVYQFFLIPPPTLIPIGTLGFPTITGYTGADSECVDCTIRGTKQQPAFWK